MKRITVVTLIIAMLSSLCGFAYDYEESWAASEIKELVDAGCISGDEKGNINPEKNITRAELVKVVNRVMGFSEKAEEGFADVSENEWYYEEFLIARKKGTINGDGMGLANPNKQVTREEAFKIIASATGKTGGEDISFIDENEISSWAVPYVKALVKGKIIRGYEDGSIRPKNKITRQEVFYILCLVKREIEGKEEIKQEEKPKAESKPQTGNVNIPAPRPSSGGGGGGSSSGGSSAEKKLSSPVITLLDDELNINWKKVATADSYTIMLDDGTNKKELEADGKATSASLKKVISELCEADRGHDELEISISMTASRGSKTSAESAVATVTVKVSEMISTADLGLKVIYTTIDGERGFYAIWEKEGVTKLTLKLEDKDTIIENPVSPCNITEYITGEDFRYIVIATAGEDKQMADVDLSSSYFAAGSGTEEDPYVIAEGYQFENISRNMSAHYLQTADITLDVDFVPLSVKAEAPFSGTYQTEGEVSITTSICGTDEYASLFGKLDGASVSGITAKGNIMSTGKYTGAVAGDIKNSTVTGCISEMNIIGDGGYTGGICGNLFASVVEECENRGVVESNMPYVSGIAANCESGTEIKGCTNNGTVISYADAENVFAGGIAGRTVGLVADCVNGADALVKGGNATGGIVGYIIGAGAVTDSCTNLGSVYYENNTRLTNLGGIVGVLRSGTVTNCVNGESGNVRIGFPSASIGVGIGGIVGQSYSGTLITLCSNAGSIYSDTSGKGVYAGGICGNTQGTVSLCRNESADIYALYGGGIAGRSGTEYIKFCYNTGNINGESGYIGGIVGRNDSATVSSCFSIGNVSGKNSASLVCLNNAAAAKLTDSYCVISGTVTNAVAKTQKGTLTNVYYYVAEGGKLLITDQQGTSVTGEELKSMPAGIEDINGWCVLAIDDNNSYPYPQLKENPYYGE